MNTFFAWLEHLSLFEFSIFTLGANIIMCTVSVISCAAINTCCSRRILPCDNQPFSLRDVLLSLSTVFLNSGVGVIGWFLWKNEVISMSTGTGIISILETIIMLILMDLGMYTFHRMAHAKGVYEVAHSTHHTHTSTNPISLFVLNPLEVLGFGSLLLVLMSTISFSGTSVISYLALNLIFGTLGHLSVEVLSPRVSSIKIVRLIGWTTFHVLHHRDPDTNFGFYTTLWDRLFGTLNPEYDSRLSGFTL